MDKLKNCSRKYQEMVLQTCTMAEPVKKVHSLQRDSVSEKDVFSNLE